MPIHKLTIVISSIWTNLRCLIKDPSTCECAAQQLALIMVLYIQNVHISDMSCSKTPLLSLSFLDTTAEIYEQAHMPTRFLSLLTVMTEAKYEKISRHLGSLFHLNSSSTQIHRIGDKWLANLKSSFSKPDKTHLAHQSQQGHPITK